jgi:hypothetical protein
MLLLREPVGQHLHAKPYSPTSTNLNTLPPIGSSGAQREPSEDDPSVGDRLKGVLKPLSLAGTLTTVFTSAMTFHRSTANELNGRVVERVREPSGALSVADIGLGPNLNQSGRQETEPLVRRRPRRPPDAARLTLDEAMSRDDPAIRAPRRGASLMPLHAAAPDSPPKFRRPDRRTPLRLPRLGLLPPRPC